MNFTWDQDKAASNLEKHGLSFEEASSAFADPLSRTRPDPLHSDEEDRLVLLDLTTAGQLAIVVRTKEAVAMNDRTTAAYDRWAATYDSDPNPQTNRCCDGESSS